MGGKGELKQSFLEENDHYHHHKTPTIYGKMVDSMFGIINV